MSFNNPSFLWAFGVLAIPILLHFLQLRRYKKLHFSDLSLLKSIQKDQQKRKVIKDWLLLMLRLLALSALVLAFAQPNFDTEQSKTSDNYPLVLYIDNSPSMNLQTTEGSLWNVAVQKARLLINNADPQQKYLCFTNDLNGSELRELSSMEMLDALNDIKPGNSQINWSQIKTRLSSRYPADSMNILLFSDFQEQFFSENVANPHLICVRLTPEKMEGNISVDTAWIDSPVVIPGSNVEVHYKVSGFNNNQIDQLKMTLMVNGVERGFQTLTLANNSSVLGKFNYIIDQDPTQQIEIVVNDEPIHFDNIYRLVITVDDQLRVLSIGDTKINALERIFRDSTTQFVQSTPKTIPFDELSSFDAIFAEESNQYSNGAISALTGYAENGGNLVYLPVTNGSTSLLGELGQENSIYMANKEVQPSKLFSDDPFFHGMFDHIPNNPKLPSIDGYVTLTDHQANVLIGLSNYSPWIIRQKFGTGQLYFIGSSLRDSPWIENELCAPIIWQMALFKANRTNLNFRMNSDNIITMHELHSSEPPVVLKMGHEEIIPKQWISPSGLAIDPKASWSKSGFAQVTLRGDTLQTWSYQSSVEEGRLNYMSDEEIMNRTSGLARLMTDNENTEIISFAMNSKDKSDWLYFIYAALLFFLMETIVLRLTKR